MRAQRAQREARVKDVLMPPENEAMSPQRGAVR